MSPLLKAFPPSFAFAYDCAGQRRAFELRGRTAGYVLAGAAGVVLMAGFGLFHAVFGDAVLSGMPRREAEIRAEYENRMAMLRHRIDHLASKQVIDRNTIEGTVQDLVTRQARIEMRHAMVANLMASAARPAAVSPSQPQPAPVPLPVPTTAVPKGATPDPRIRTDRFERPRDARAEAPAASPRHVEAVAALGAKIAVLEAMQLDAALQVSAAARAEVDQFSRALAELRLKLPETAPVTDRNAMGGPYLPVATTFEAALASARAVTAERNRLAGIVEGLPLARPLDGDPEIASGFGVRTDPFTRQPALHAGLDLKREPGAPVRATGSGTVTAAEWSGGYGNMVEIDHGRGITTIYGHLSTIQARVGQSVAAGALIGTVGSTGRSTGPHLHYETRIADEAVDPVRFLRAGERLRRR